MPNCLLSPPNVPCSSSHENQLTLTWKEGGENVLCFKEVAILIQDCYIKVGLNKALKWVCHIFISYLLKIEKILRIKATMKKSMFWKCLWIATLQRSDVLKLSFFECNKHKGKQNVKRKENKFLPSCSSFPACLLYFALTIRSYLGRSEWMNLQKNVTTSSWIQSLEYDCQNYP